MTSFAIETETVVKIVKPLVDLDSDSVKDGSSMSFFGDPWSSFRLTTQALDWDRGRPARLNVGCHLSFALNGVLTFDSKRCLRRAGRPLSQSRA